MKFNHTTFFPNSVMCFFSLKMLYWQTFRDHCNAKLFPVSYSLQYCNLGHSGTLFVGNWGTLCHWLKHRILYCAFVFRTLLISTIIKIPVGSYQGILYVIVSFVYRYDCTLFLFIWDLPTLMMLVNNLLRYRATLCPP